MKKIGRPRLEENDSKLSLTKLSKRWGATSEQIHGWMDEGMPYKRNGRAYEFDLKECVKWYRGERVG